MVTPPPTVTGIQKMGPPFRLIAKGNNLQNGIHVLINGTQWTNTAWKSTTKIVIKGGAALKAVIPKNTPVTLTFVNPDGGMASPLYAFFDASGLGAACLQPLLWEPSRSLTC